MTVPFGTVATRLTTVPAAFKSATDQPAEASDALTVNGALDMLTNSMYSSAVPTAPCMRNSLMDSVVEASGKLGGWTVTLNWQVAAFAPVTVTIVVPTGKVEPEGVL